EIPKGLNGRKPGRAGLAVAALRERFLQGALEQDACGDAEPGAAIITAVHQVERAGDESQDFAERQLAEHLLLEGIEDVRTPFWLVGEPLHLAATPPPFEEDSLKEGRVALGVDDDDGPVAAADELDHVGDETGIA